MQVTAYNQTRGEVLVSRGWAATTVFRRLRGLIGYRPLEPGEGLLIRPCSGIHTIGMRVAVDVVFLSPDGRVLKSASSVRPNRLGPVALRAVAALELPDGTIARTGTQVGDVIEIG